MKKINYNFIQKYYESFSFVLPRLLSQEEQIVIAKFNNWSLLNSFKFFFFYKKFLSFFFFLLKRNAKLVSRFKKKKKKLFFIFDTNETTSFFEGVLKKHKQFYANDLKSVSDFLRANVYKNRVLGVVYVGENPEISTKLLNKIELPIFSFSAINVKVADYLNYSSQDFRSSLLLIRIVIEIVLAKIKEFSKNIDNNPNLDKNKYKKGLNNKFKFNYKHKPKRKYKKYYNYGKNKSI